MTAAYPSDPRLDNLLPALTFLSGPAGGKSMIQSQLTPCLLHPRSVVALALTIEFTFTHSGQS